MKNDKLISLLISICLVIVLIALVSFRFFFSQYLVLIPFFFSLLGVCEVPDEVKEAAELKGIDIYIEKTPKAAKLFNVFVGQKKRVVAVLHSTC